jgi:hypothetical protein
MRLCTLGASTLAIAMMSSAAIAVPFQIGNRPEIGAIEAPKVVKAGQSVPITVTAKKDGNSGCGLMVDFGDGSDRQLKINGDDGKLPVTVAHTYKKDGQYTVRVKGRVITTNKECKGSASAVIRVGEPKPVKKAAK